MKLETRSEAHWLEERRSRVTATELAELHRNKTSATWSRIKQEKLTGERHDISHLPNVQWGIEREPILAEFLTSVYEELVYNDHPQTIFVMDSNTRVCGTPDLYTENLDVLGEIKTAEQPFTGGAYDDVLPDQYFLQAQVNMLVTGAETMHLLVEYHQSMQPTSTQLHTITADTDLHAGLLETATEFLTYLDGDTPGWLTDTIDLDAMDTLTQLVTEYAASKKVSDPELKTQKQLREAILAITGTNATLDCEGHHVTVSTSKPTMIVDRAKLKKHYPDVYQACAKTQAGATRLTITPVKDL